MRCPYESGGRRPANGAGAVWAPQALCPTCDTVSFVKPSLVEAILTDVQFWVPVGVLIFGIVVLAVVR
jgi:hypothetical protein